MPPGRALSLLLTAGLFAVVSCATSRVSVSPASTWPPSTPTTIRSLDLSTGSVTFAFISDTPTGSRAIDWFPLLVDQVNGDTAVEFVAHGGDIRGGDTDCSDASYEVTSALMQTFDDPFWYVPGDNEWADCHRNGGFLPTERLDKVRTVFFPDPLSTTGPAPLRVERQSQIGPPETQRFVEHTRFERECLIFGAVHVVGSKDDGEPWGEFPGDPAAGLAAGDQPDLRLAARAERRSAALLWLADLFATATSRRARGVVVMMHAEPTDDPAFAEVRAALFAHVSAFDGEVLLIHGDSHTYQDTPGYGGVANLTRLEAPGDEGALNRWLKVTADCGPGAATMYSHELLFFDVPVGSGG